MEKQIVRASTVKFEFTYPMTTKMVGSRCLLVGNMKSKTYPKIMEEWKYD